MKLKLEKMVIDDISEIEGYTLYIVDSYTEFKVYNEKEFFNKYSDCMTIKNLYCVNMNEELRLNNNNWVKIYESETEGFDILKKEKKDIIGDDKKLAVYKYILTSEYIKKNKFSYLKANPILYKHCIIGENN